MDARSTGAGSGTVPYLNPFQSTVLPAKLTVTGSGVRSDRMFQNTVPARAVRNGGERWLHNDVQTTYDSYITMASVTRRSPPEIPTIM